jgi:hypothetical protein
MLSYFRNYLVGISILLTSTIALAGAMGNTASAVVDNDPDCDNVAIIRCGVFSESAMREKASQNDVPRVFNALGVSQADLKGKFVDGIVWRDGRVTVGNKTVATGAMTAGRNFGGTPIPNTNNAGIYPTSKFVTEGQTAFVKMKADGTFDFAVIKACGNPVKATPKKVKEETPNPTPQETPKVECIGLTADRIGTTNRYTFTARATMSGGAKIEKYEFGFGDGMGITVAENAYTYEYKQPGNYKASVVVHYKAGDKTLKATSPACEYAVSIVKPPVVTPETCPYNTSLPKDSPDCKKPVEYCPLKGKETLPKDSPECEEDEEEPTPVVVTPTALPDTGAGALIGGAMGTSFLSYGAYTYLQSRRNLLNKLLGR